MASYRSTEKKEADGMLSDFYKHNETDQIWWVQDMDAFGRHLFSFDKKKIYNLFQDYLYKLTDQENKIFDRENPYWANYFRGRSKE